MARRFLSKWRGVRGSDEDLTRQLHRLDPYDVMGYLALAATLANIAVSAIMPYYAFDVLISISFIFGVLSILNWGSLVGKLAVGLMICHAVVLHILRVTWPI